MKNTRLVEDYKIQVEEYVQIYGFECFFDGTITFEQLALSYENADCSCGLSIEEATAIIQRIATQAKESQEAWS